MPDKMFEFRPSDYADFFATHGYVHIPRGVTKPFYERMLRQVERNIKTAVMKEFAIGDKQQAMYEFPDGGDYPQELCDTVGAVCGIDPSSLVLSERHVKAYEPDAAPEPNAHKDRFASQISVGLSVHVRDGSTLVLFPYDELDTNPFNTSVQLRASLSADRYPEPVLKSARRIEIKDAARDVIIFRGHRIWHLRANPANTTMLYFKLNALNCDPLGEDRRTAEFQRRTQEALELDDEQLARLVPMIGRRVDFIHRLYNRDWREVIGVVLWGEKHFTIDEDELAMLRAMNGEDTVGAIAGRGPSGTSRGATATTMAKVRRLARRGVIDLLPPARRPDGNVMTGTPHAADSLPLPSYR